MKLRIYEIEGSDYKSVSKSLFECVVKKDIKYEPSFFIKKGVIKKAYLEGVKLNIIISSGNFYPCLFISFFVMIVLCVIFTFMN